MGVRWLLICVSVSIFMGCSVAKNDATADVFVERELLGSWVDAEYRWNFWGNGRGYLELFLPSSDINLEDTFQWRLEGNVLTIESDASASMWFVGEYKVAIYKKKGKNKLRLLAVNKSEEILLEKE